MPWVCILLALNFSCEQKRTQADTDYIHFLEDKNKILERELEEEKSKQSKFLVSPESAISDFKENNNRKNGEDFFYIGSTEKEVIEVMGEPTEMTNFGSGMTNFKYGLFSSVSFRDGKVSGYNNFGKNLKVKMKK